MDREMDIIYILLLLFWGWDDISIFIKLTLYNSNWDMQGFRRLDIFKKVPRDLSEGTNLGGCLSILTVCVILFFLIS